MSMLEPCPFCGAPAEINITDRVPKGCYYTPRCVRPSCCGRLTKKYQDKEVAIAMWNHRVTYFKKEKTNETLV